MKRLYTLQPPQAVRSALMQTDEFYIPHSQLGIKTAAYLEVATLESRCDLFKLAAEDGDLSKAYTKLQNIERIDESEAEDDEEEPSDDFGGFQLREDSEAEDEESEATDDTEESDEEE